MRRLTFGSVCSGIEAASSAWETLGWKADWLAEIEPFPAAVLAYRYPDVPNLGDMKILPRLVLSGVIAAPDVLVGGTPCQSFSVAGLRGSLEDERGQLTMAYIKLLNKIDEVRSNAGRKPAIAVWENVPGVLSSKDNAFGCFLAGLAGESSELQPPREKWSNAGYVLGPQRAIAWRVLDAQYFGLAQRRKRVFVVASARDGFDPAKILFEFDGVRRDSAPSRETGQSFTHDIAPRLVSSGRVVSRVGDTRGQDPVVAAAKPFRMAAFGEYVDDESASTMKARDYKDATDLVCVHGTQDLAISTERAHALGRNNGQENIVTAFAQNTRDEVRVLGEDGQVAGCLSANPGMKQTTYIFVRSPVFDIPCNWIGCKPENGDNAVEPHHNRAPSLTNTDRDGVVYPINTMVVQGRPSDDLKPRMGSGIGRPSDPQNTLSTAHSHGVGGSFGVRRLTPIECERLQGFPDGWTQIPWRNKPAEECPDGHRYKALGNSMAVPVMRWIGERISKELSKAQQ